jgi:hypothetical protein
MPVTDTIMEPFVIGSLWGNLSDDNQASLVSSGTTFKLEDDLQDVWGEVSAGVNFFNPSASTSVFAKVDVTFGDDLDGCRRQSRHARELVALARKSDPIIHVEDDAILMTAVGL